MAIPPTAIEPVDKRGRGSSVLARVTKIIEAALPYSAHKRKGQALFLFTQLFHNCKPKVNYLHSLLETSHKITNNQLNGYSSNAIQSSPEYVGMQQ